MFSSVDYSSVLAPEVFLFTCSSAHNMIQKWCDSLFKQKLIIQGDDSVQCESNREGQQGPDFDSGKILNGKKEEEKNHILTTCNMVAVVKNARWRSTYKNSRYHFIITVRNESLVN